MWKNEEAREETKATNTILSALVRQSLFNPPLGCLSS